MTAQNRRMALFSFVAMMLISLACTLGGSDEPTETETPEVSETPIAEVSPTSETPAPPGASDTPPGTPTDTATPTQTPIVGSGPDGCVLRGTYIADVTIPDGTELAPNATFVKTWRIKNDGTCDWGTGYQLVYASGTQMSSPAAVNIPAATVGQTIDIAVNLVAPGTPGDYSGRWRLRANNGAVFGGYTTVIKVVGTPTPTHSATPTVTPTTSTTPTASATLVGGGAWGGTWETECGLSGCDEMNLIQTGSTVVGTYDGGLGTINGTVSGNLLSGTWSRGGSSGSIDFWIEGSGLRWHGNFDKTNTWCGRRAGQSYLSPCGVSSWYGTWTANCGISACGTMTLDQTGDTVMGTYASGDGSVLGTVNGREFTGTYSRGTGNGMITFFMLSNGNQFNGNWDGVNAWCGYRIPAASDPSPCLEN